MRHLAHSSVVETVKLSAVAEGGSPEFEFDEGSLTSTARVSVSLSTLWSPDIFLLQFYPGVAASSFQSPLLFCLVFVLSLIMSTSCLFV